MPDNAGAFIRQKREKLCWTQTELAERLGTTTQEVYRWEKKGIQPQAGQWRKFTELMDRYENRRMLEVRRAL